MYLHLCKHTDFRVKVHFYSTRSLICSQVARGRLLFINEINELHLFVSKCVNERLAPLCSWDTPASGTA